MKRIQDLVSRILETTVTVFFGVILTLTILLVILRYVFNSSIIWGNEMMTYLFIYTTAIGAAIGVGKRDHISIAFFLNKLREPFKTVVDVLGLLFVAMINIVITVLSFEWIGKVGYSPSPVMRVPMWAVEICVPVGCILAALFCVFVIVNEITDLVKKGETE